MEEDLERLEKTIKDYKEHVEFSEEIEEIDKNMKALENLIVGYKELERKLTPTPDNAVPLEYQTAMYVDKRGYVSKEKIKEKIEELNLKLAEDVNRKIDATYNIRFTIQVLEELLVLED